MYLKTFWLFQNELISREGPYDGFYDCQNGNSIKSLNHLKIKQKIKSETKWSVEGISARRKRNMGRVKELEKLTEHYENTKIKEKQSMDFSKTHDMKSNIVELINADFAYDNQLDDKIVSQFNLKIKKKDRIGIIGANVLEKRH